MVSCLTFYHDEYMKKGGNQQGSCYCSLFLALCSLLRDFQKDTCCDRPQIVTVSDACLVSGIFEGKDDQERERVAEEYEVNGVVLPPLGSQLKGLAVVAQVLDSPAMTSFLMHNALNQAQSTLRAERRGEMVQTKVTL